MIIMDLSKFDFVWKRICVQDENMALVVMLLLTISNFYSFDKLNQCPEGIFGFWMNLHISIETFN